MTSPSRGGPAPWAPGTPVSPPGAGRGARGLIPATASALLGSVTEKYGPELFMVEPSGVSWGYHGCAIGKGQQAATSEIEKLDVRAVWGLRVVRWGRLRRPLARTHARANALACAAQEHDMPRVVEAGRENHHAGARQPQGQGIQPLSVVGQHHRYGSPAPLLSPPRCRDPPLIVALDGGLVC